MLSSTTGLLISVLILVSVVSACSAPATKNQRVDKADVGLDAIIKSKSKINLNDACDIYSKKPDWLVGSLEASHKWQVPIFVILAIMHQESRFVATARPLNPNKKSKKKYASSAYGYAQALDGTWKEYKQETGNISGRRDDFSSAADFIGWYTLKAHKINGTSKWATDTIYLNYHEGLGGYKRGTYKRKPWLIKVAAKVKRRGSLYARQIKACDIPLYVRKDGTVPKLKKSSQRKVTEKMRKTLRSKGIWF